MSDALPITQVPESTWLRVLAHALDPGAEPADDSLVPQDDADPQDDASAAATDDIDPWDEDADGDADAARTGDDAADLASDVDTGDPETGDGGWGAADQAGDIEELVVADGEAAADTYTAALPEDLDDHDATDDAGF